MTIIRIDSRLFKSYRDQIEMLLNSSAKLNFPGHHIGDDYGQKKCDALSIYLSENKAIVFGVLEEDDLAGWIWCHTIDRMNRKRIHVAEIAVKDCYHRQGLGKKLLRQIEKYAEENGYEEIDLLVTESNDNAVSFYRKAGFETERLLMKKKL